jgi:hypothetical protein
MISMLPFAEAIASFRSFVSEQGFPSDLVWVFREDVLRIGRHLLVRVPVAAENAILARDYFELGRAQGRGVTLMAWCPLEGRSVCSVWVPRDDREASEALQAPTLKCSAALPSGKAWAIRSRRSWCWLTWWQGRRDQALREYLPARSDIKNQIRAAI